MAFEGLSGKLNQVFKKLKSHGKLTESDVKEAMREVRMALLEADVSYKVVKDFVKKVSDRAVGEEVLTSLTPAQQVIKIVNEELCNLMGNENARIQFPSKPPCIIMMCGLQGSGKTTHAAKLAKMLKKEGHFPLLVACDIYRPAAINQLQVVGERAGVKVFEMGQIDPRIIAKEALKFAKDHGNDVVILDTAGRLHIDVALMDELKDLKELTHPNEIMLVVDAMTGQDAVNVAKAFDDALGIDSVLMSKLDSDTRGGAALSVLAVTGKPIKFQGTGEKLDMIEPLHPDRMVIATTPQEIRTIKAQGKKAICLGIENGYALGKLVENLRMFKEMGVSYITLCHNGDNDICDSARGKQEWKGLSPFGKEVVKEMNRLGIMVDISHAAESTFYQVLEVSETPIIASHSSARPLCDHPRNLTDDQLKALAAQGGVAQICLYKGFINKEEEKASLSDAIRHINHIVDLIGIDHVGIGSDFDGDGELIGCSATNELINITVRLLEEGYTEEDIRKIWGGNLLRVMTAIQDFPNK